MFASLPLASQQFRSAAPAGSTGASRRPQCARRQGALQAVAAPVGSQTRQLAEVKLPDELRKNVAVLEAPNPSAPGGKTQVYVLGMSHVSKRSVSQVKELIGLVKPDVVAVELCKDRLSGLIDPDAAMRTNNTWHSRTVIIQGLPDAPGWPTQGQLKSLLRSRLGRPVSASEIEADVRTLLATGLFKSVRPMCVPPTIREAPAFRVVPSPDGSGVKLQIIPPLDSIRFIVTPRVLPPLADVALRLDSSLRASDVPLPALEAAAAEALAQAKSGSSSGAGAASTPSSVDAYMALRAELKSLCSQDVAVSFSGAELGRVEVIVKAAKASDAPFLSGLEGSAANGEGLGIDAFRPPKPVFSASKKLNIELETLDAMRAAAQGGGASPDGISTSAPSSSSTSSSSKSLDLGAGRTQFREWTERDVEEGFVRAGELDELEPVADTLAAVLTSQYSKQQERAARKVGVSPGAAWRAALEAATAAGVQQFLLVDLPTNVTQRRLADGVLASVGGSLVGAAAMVATTAAVVAFTDLLPQPAEYACLALAATLAAGLVAPLIGPIQEISKLADKDPEQIEAAVSDHASLLQPSTAAASSSGVKAATRLPGEDALIDWPGALRPIVEERDSYMARALAAAAVPGRRGVSPAFVLDRADGQPVWRYMMAEGAPDAAAPAGLGDAAYAPLPGGAQRIVAVVGAVHVSGMAAAWAESLADSSVAGLLPTARAAASK